MKTRIAILVVSLLAAFTLQGCITVAHTFKDGTTVRASDTGRVSVTSGKSTIELELPQK